MKKRLKEILISTGTILSWYANETLMTPYFQKVTSNASRIESDLNHVISAVGVPYMMSLAYSFIDKERQFPKFISYASLSLLWESAQFLGRGYFQFEQLACDVLGLGIAYLLDKHFINKTKRISKNL